jgi:hypothetical protein
VKQATTSIYAIFCSSTLRIRLFDLFNSELITENVTFGRLVELLGLGSGGSKGFYPCRTKRGATSMPHWNSNAEGPILDLSATVLYLYADLFNYAVCINAISHLY